jgi:hypothetical protein
MFKDIRDQEELVALINRLLTLVNQRVNDSKFTGSPLYIKMTATAYELDIDRWIRLGFPRQPWEIDVVCLCDKFVESKLHISLTDRERADITNDNILDYHERLKQMLLEAFERCALVATLPSPILELLHNKKIHEETQPFLDRVQAGKDKTCIVMHVVDGKPQFMHRTFAEYFAARWFSKYFESNRRVLEQIFSTADTGSLGTCSTGCLRKALTLLRYIVGNFRISQISSYTMKLLWTRLTVYCSGRPCTTP